MALDDKQEAELRAQLKTAEEDAEKWKGLARKHEDRSKENAAAADELKKLKDASRSDDERRKAADDEAAQKLADIQKQLDEEKSARMRAEVAASKGLTPAQAKRLAGATREELEADADELLESFPKPADTGGGSDKERPRPATRPRTEVSGGGNPTEEAAVETNPAKLAESVPRF